MSSSRISQFALATTIGLFSTLATTSSRAQEASLRKPVLGPVTVSSLREHPNIDFSWKPKLPLAPSPQISPFSDILKPSGFSTAKQANHVNFNLTSRFQAGNQAEFGFGAVGRLVGPMMEHGRIGPLEVVDGGLVRIHILKNFAPAFTGRDAWPGANQLPATKSILNAYQHQVTIGP